MKPITHATIASLDLRARRKVAWNPMSEVVPRLGFTLPYEGAVTAGDIVRVARAADEAGFHSAWVGDHVIFPAVTASQNPTTRTGAYPVPHDTPRLDAFGVLFTAAVCTQRIRLGVGAAVAAYRPAPLLAKLVSTLDCLSDGRATLALGMGWLREEFRALGVDFAQRRSLLEETVEVCRRLWTESTPSFEGRHYSFGPSHFEPKPPQGQIPILMGGHVDAALRRAGRLGDGWYGSRLLPSEIPRMLAAIDEGRREAERASFPFETGVTRLVALGPGSHDGLVLGLDDPERVRKELEAYADVGIGTVVLSVDGQRPDDMVQAVEVIRDAMR
jgi:probable F420-dependent oxidoreductase